MFEETTPHIGVGPDSQESDGRGEEGRPLSNGMLRASASVIGLPRTREEEHDNGHGTAGLRQGAVVGMSTSIAERQRKRLAGEKREDYASRTNGRRDTRDTQSSPARDTRGESMNTVHKNSMAQGRRGQLKSTRRGRNLDGRESAIELRCSPVRGRQVAGRQRTMPAGASRQNRGASPSARGRVDTTHSNAFKGHRRQVLALACHGDVLFSAAADGTAKAWDTHTRECLATYEGHRRAIWTLQATGKTLVTGSADGTVRFWDIETIRALHVIDLRLPVRDIVMVDDFLAVATSSPGIEIIDLIGMKRHRTIQGHLLAVSALASLDAGKYLVSGSHDTFIRIWNPRTGSCDAVLGGHSGTIGALASLKPPLPRQQRSIDPRGRRAEESIVVSGSGDATVRVWGRDGEEGGWICLVTLEGHRHGVWAIDVSATMPGMFATGGGDASVKIWTPTAHLPEDRCDKDHNEKESGMTFFGSAGWECAGGVRGTVGAVGAVLLTKNSLNFGTSEAVIASFPLQSCMPVRA